MTRKDPLLAGLGSAIRTLRLERGILSQAQLARDSDLHPNYVSGIERAERQPTLQTVAKLSAGLGVAPSQLLARAERDAERHGASWPATTDDTPPDETGKEPEKAS